MKTFLPYAVIFLAATGFFVWYLSPKEVFIKNKCNITKSECTLSNPKKNIEVLFSTGAKNIDYKKPVTYRVKVSGLKNPQAKIYLFGQSMAMQTEQIELESKGSGEFVATKTFPICTTSSMIWRAHLRVKGEDKIVKSNFDFEVKR